MLFSFYYVVLCVFLLIFYFVNIERDSRGIEKDSQGKEKDSRGEEKDSRGIEQDSRGEEQDSRGEEKDSRGEEQVFLALELAILFFVLFVGGVVGGWSASKMLGFLGRHGCTLFLSTIYFKMVFDTFFVPF